MPPIGILIPLGLVLAGPAEPEPAANRPVVTLRAAHPDRQLGALLELFSGARAASPAAALAGWKRAAADPKRLGKTTEGIISAFNPRMIPEFRNLDGAVFGARRDPGLNRWLWRATLPRDDGTIGAVVATTLLSGGRPGPALPGTMGDSPVFYLTNGPAPLLTRVGPTLVLSNDPTQLGQAVRSASEPPWTGLDPGWIYTVELPLLDQQWPTLAGRRVEAILREGDLQYLSGRIRIEGPTLVTDWLRSGGIGPPRLPPIDPAWAAIVPARGALAAWAVRVDPRPEAWGRFFDLVDRVERLDPERAHVAPSRFRLALAARALGIRLDAVVLPHLVGFSGWIGPEGDDLAGRGVVALHFDDEGAPRQVVADVRANRRVRTPVVAQPEVEAEVDLGRVAGRATQLHRLGGSLYLAWGDRAWAAALEARDHPERSARRFLTENRSGVAPPRAAGEFNLSGAAPSRAGALWLDQALRGRPDVAELAASLAEGPPLRWAGGINNHNTAFAPTDEVWLDGLDATIRRFLDRIPFDPPPDR